MSEAEETAEAIVQAAVTGKPVRFTAILQLAKAYLQLLQLVKEWHPLEACEPSECELGQFLGYSLEKMS